MCLFLHLREQGNLVITWVNSTDLYTLLFLKKSETPPKIMFASSQHILTLLETNCFKKDTE